MRNALRAAARAVLDSRRFGPAARGALETLRRIALREETIVAATGALRFDPRTWVIKQTPYGFRLWVSLEERSISREILLDRFEPEETAFVRAEVRPGATVVDAGANIGYYTLLLATLAGAAGRVIAFEPFGTVADALERSLAENPGIVAVELHRVALDETAREVRLRHAPVTINAGAGYLAPDAPLPPGHVDETVAARSLDAVVGERPCAFVKLDVEGAEPRVLRGARRLLERERPVMLCEINDALLRRVGGSGANDLLALIRALGYTARALRGGARGEPIERYAGHSINVVLDPSAR